MSGKKLLNSVERCVDENLEGLVTINPGLRLIEDTRVIVRADIEIVKNAGKVTVLCGGGSGHEPAHAGYVGCGMLSCAVAGSVFTSPPPQDILTGLRMIAEDNPAGALVIIMNYSGDRINFGLALERAKTEGMSCDMVVVGEDCALKSHDKTAGRRGLCGTVFIHKIAGALAEEGKSLDEVTKLTQQAADSMGTIGLALGACSTPGSSGPLFTVQPDEMELGLGLHGEAGVKRIKLMSAKETVKVMIDHMTNPDNSTHLAVKKGDRVACMINNLGGMSVLEMNVVAKETIQYLEGDLGLRVNRAYCATYMTSLEMAGISISLLHLNDTFVRCLDAPTSAPGWQVPLFGPCQTDRRTPGLMLPVGGPSSETQQTRGTSVSKVLSKQYKTMSGKKLLNSVERCVDENLEGLVTINPGLRLIKDTRVIVRADIEAVKNAGKVTVLCGGGSGHEPAHAGYVGCGMLSCAVAGSVFTSPPPQDILTGLRMIAKDNPAGALIIIKNYSGDRINFGLALEQAKTEGMSCDMVVVGEDCALKSHDKTAGRRGLCGTVFIHKIAGALAEEGKSLDEVTKLTQQAADSMGTIGLALGACSTPGSSGPLFTIQPDEMELGLGLRGESGVKRIKLMSAKETVKVMIDHMTNPDNSTHLAIKKGDRVACMINNLGGMSVLEMNVVAKETIQYLEGNLGLRVNRAYCATYVTSLEMAGISISLLHLNDTFIRCLDAPTSAPGWQVQLFGPCQTDRRTPGLMLPVGGLSSETQKTRGTSVSKDEGDKIYDIIEKVCERLQSAKEQLDSLDSESGDGDCGSTMASGAQCVREKLGEKESPGLPVANPSQLSLELANIVETVMDGSSGGIYSLFFTAAATALQKEVTAQSWLQAMTSGMAAVQRYGGAEPGDRTMLDALFAAKETFEKKLTDSSPVEAFREAVKAAETAAENTKSMSARAGRASYVSADLLTKPDPGAMAVAVWLKAILELLNGCQ